MSNQVQIDQCQKYCDTYAWKVDSVFQDAAISGKSAHGRPEFLQAIAKAKQLKCPLVVYSLSRFARNTREALFYVERLKDSGADLVSLTEKIDTTSPTGRFFFTIIAALATLEREQAGERTRSALAYLKIKGRRVSRFAPYGYRIDPKTDRLIRDPAEEKAVRRICELREGGMSYSQISEVLEASHHVPRGKSWYPATVQRICDYWEDHSEEKPPTPNAEESHPTLDEPK